MHHLQQALGQHIAAERFHATLDLHHHKATDRCGVFEDVIFAVLFFACNEIKVEPGGLFQQFVGDFFRVIPLKRLSAIFFLCFRAIERQQPRGGRGLDFFFHGAGRHRNGNNLLRFSLHRLRDVGAEILHAQTREARYAQRFGQRNVKWLACPRGEQTFIHFDGDAAVLLRRAEIFGMHVCIQFQLVLTHREFGGLPPHAPSAVGLSGELQRDAFFHFAAVDWMRKINIKHRFFQRRIGRILVELCTGNFCQQRRCLKFHRVRGQPNL